MKTPFTLRAAFLAGFDATLGPARAQSVECCEYLSEMLLQCNQFSMVVPTYSRRVYAYYHHFRGTQKKRGSQGSIRPHTQDADAAGRHTKDVNLFMQVQDAYRLMYDRLSRDAAYCERNRDRQRYGYNVVFIYNSVVLIVRF
jgi:hypothetical protein